jgi:di/tricarboxylate transporter
VSDETITFLVLAAVVAVFVWDRYPVALVAVATALSLWAAGVLELEKALAGFGDPTVVFIASLFVVSEALDATGATSWVGQALIARVGGDRTRAVILTMVLAAVVSSLITVTAAVVALLPVIVVMAVRLRRSPSQLLMPLAFAGHAGSLLTLTGTPVNVIASDTAEEAGAGRFNYFEFALVGLPLVLGTVVIVLLLGPRLLPDRRARMITRDLTRHAHVLVEQYGIAEPPETLLTRTIGVAEVVVPPRSELVGDKVFPGMVTESGDLVVLAVQRKGEELAGESTLAAGDALLLQGTWEALGYHLDDPELLVVDRPELVLRQAVPLGPGAKRAIGVLLAMVALLATGAVPPAVAGLLAAGAVVLLGVLSMDQAFRAIDWTTVILIGGMISLSVAMVDSGAAEQLADRLVDVVDSAGAYALLLGLFLLTAVLGQLISNMATALIVIPVALSAAAEMDVSVKPVLMTVAVSAAASFLTPVATPANLMVLGPGGYRFGDYWKLGLPLLALFGIVAVLVVPIFWRL